MDEDEESGRAPRRGGGGTVERERRAGVKAETRGVGVRAPAGRGRGRARARQTRGPSGRGDESVARGFASRRASPPRRRGSDCGASDASARAADIVQTRRKGESAKRRRTAKVRAASASVSANHAPSITRAAGAATCAARRGTRAEEGSPDRRGTTRDARGAHAKIGARRVMGNFPRRVRG